jgi:uncharacterized protein YndB with AHSA1/START domain
MHGKDSAAAREFVITRTFRAPRELVFRVWTDPEHLKRWFGPAGMTMTQCQADIRPGGSVHYCLRTPDGIEMWGKWKYLEIVPPSRIVLIQWFSDAAGGLTRHPMNPAWPRHTRSTTAFEEQHGQTTLTLRWAPHEATPQEQAVFDGAHGGMQQGWTGTMDRLADYLVRLPD